MFFKTDKSYRYVFLLIISLMTVFNKSSNYIFIQFNFIAISIFFLLFIKEKNYFAHIRKIFSKNKIAISLFFFFYNFFNLSNNTLAHRMDKKFISRKICFSEQIRI